MATNPAPAGTRILVKAIMDALDAIPVINRKAAFKYATAAVKEKLVAQAEKAKVASRQAPRAGKQAAAVRATRRATREDKPEPLF